MFQDYVAHVVHQRDNENNTYETAAKEKLFVEGKSTVYLRQAVLADLHCSIALEAGAVVLRSNQQGKSYLHGGWFLLRSSAQALM